MYAVPVSADQMEDLAKSKQCFDCHQLDKDAIAPSFMSIAKKYKGVKNAEVMMADRIQKGGVAHFGNTPMPSQGARVSLSAAEANSLAALQAG
jgi:cytochrome c